MLKRNTMFQLPKKVRTKTGRALEERKGEEKKRRKSLFDPVQASPLTVI